MHNNSLNHLVVLYIYQKEIDKGDVQNIAKSWFGLLQFSYDFVSFLQAVLLYHNDTCFPDVRIFVVERLMGYISYLINGYKKASLILNLAVDIFVVCYY